MGAELFGIRKNGFGLRKMVAEGKNGFMGAGVGVWRREWLGKTVCEEERFPEVYEWFGRVKGK